MEGGPPSSCLQRGAPCHGIIGIMVNPPLHTTNRQQIEVMESEHVAVRETATGD